MPFYIVEKGECHRCNGRGRGWHWAGNRWVDNDYICYYCEGVGKLDREVDLLDALRELGVVRRGDTV